MDGINSTNCYIKKKKAGWMKRKEIWLWGNLGKLLGGYNCSDISLKRIWSRQGWENGGSISCGRHSENKLM